MVSNWLPRSTAFSRAGGAEISQTLPIEAEKSAPELASMTFFRSAGRLSYFGRVHRDDEQRGIQEGCDLSVSEWNRVISCSFTAGITSQGST